MSLRIWWAIIVCWSAAVGRFADAEAISETKFHIDGKVNVKLVRGDADGDENWFQEARIFVDTAQHIGILK